MSAYLHRLIARDQPTNTAISPFVRSQSPIAAIDQRLAVDESLGHGFSALEGGEAPSDELNPAPPPITDPARESSTTIHRKVAAPSVAPPSIASPAVAAERASAPVRARSPQLDPGPLFDLDPTPRHFEETRIHEIVRESAPASLAPEPHVAPRPFAEPRIAPVTPAEARITPRPTPEPSVAFAPAFEPHIEPSQPPWRRFEPTVVPALVPSHPGPASPEPMPARLEPSPRSHQPIAVHPAELPTTDSVQVQTPRSVQVRIGQVDIEIVPSSPHAPAPSQRKARPNIESISQIGPLDRHFPNRRRLRLRYR